MNSDSSNHVKSNAGILILKILIFGIGIAGTCFLWVLGGLMIAFGFVNQTPMVIFMTLVLLSLLVMLYAFLFCKTRKIWKYSGAAAFFFLLILCAIPAYRYFTVERFKQVNDRINWYAYDPWRAGTKVVVVDAAPEFKIKKDLPRIDGAYALYPVYSGVVRALYDKNKFEDGQYLNTNGSDRTFSRLLEKRVDLIFSAPPSKQQIADATAKGLKYEITPFAKEAFVFFVNSKNPIENITSQQIRDIYAGKITDWSQIDPELNGKIKPFQRNKGSGSQTMLEKIMKNEIIMPPLKEDRLGGMGGIINDVAGYRNYQEAIGFTFRYFSTEMFRNGEIKLLAIDGIAPTMENIRNGTYPFIADCCIITVKPRDENIKKIVDFMFSPHGKELIEKTGYVALPRRK
ncbi:MAG: substrate-binding domain-containing protein [Lentisphaeria bacterium]|nr:substrate-binding domain-containing protein [Lentisphaeria bacterium]